MAIHHGQLIELAETGEQFRRIVFEDIGGKQLAHLTTASSVYAPVEMRSTYKLRIMMVSHLFGDFNNSK